MSTRQSSVARPANVTDDLESSLRASRALRELISLEEAELALKAAAAGFTQRRIATALGRSQTDVHRILRRARAGAPSKVRKLILEAVAGRETHAFVIGRLSAGIDRGTAPNTEQQDGYLPSELDEVRRAFLEGLITEDEYNRIRGAAPLDSASP